MVIAKIDYLISLRSFHNCFIEQTNRRNFNYKHLIYTKMIKEVVFAVI